VSILTCYRPLMRTVANSSLRAATFSPAAKFVGCHCSYDICIAFLLLPQLPVVLLQEACCVVVLMSSPIYL
jgi:hypothetical protein